MVSPTHLQRPPAADCLVTGGPGNTFTLLPRGTGEHESVAAWVCRSGRDEELVLDVGHAGRGPSQPFELLALSP